MASAISASLTFASRAVPRSTARITRMIASQPVRPVMSLRGGIINLGQSTIARSVRPRDVTRSALANSSPPDSASKSDMPIPNLNGFFPDEMHDDYTNLPLSADLCVKRKNLFGGRELTTADKGFMAFMLIIHGVACLAPFTFTWSAFGAFLVGYLITGMLGITLSYHRQLTHRSFRTPKWLEYTIAYCGALAVQGDPIEWASSHRYHHIHCDTPKDPHSPFEGFFYSHMGWLLDQKATGARVSDRSNASDLAKDPFYRWLADTYVWHVVASYVLLFAVGGLPWLVWAGALRTCWVYHITWFVNSASHVWGYQTYKTGDLSRNNWWVGLLAFGEGWHNNHHAFEYSARHGLEDHQIDMTWYTIKLLEKLGLADSIKLPTEKQLAKLRIVPKKH